MKWNDRTKGHIPEASSVWTWEGSDGWVQNSELVVDGRVGRGAAALVRRRRGLGRRRRRGAVVGGAARWQRGAAQVTAAGHQVLLVHQKLVQVVDVADGQPQRLHLAQPLLPGARACPTPPAHRQAKLTCRRRAGGCAASRSRR